MLTSKRSLSAEDRLAAYTFETAGVTVFRGPETDVLARFLGAAEISGADAVARVTADCPLLCPSVARRVVEEFRRGDSRYDYVSNTVSRTFPHGLDVEVFTADALRTAGRGAVLEFDREHVTPFLWRQPSRFRIGQVTDSVDRSGHRWTLDTPEDFDLISRIYADLYPGLPAFEYHDILGCLARHPDWSSINRHVAQRSET